MCSHSLTAAAAPAVPSSLSALLVMLLRYSILASELASQGYLVLALEHGDGTACATRPPGAADWLLYQRMGDDEAKVRWVGCDVL